MGRGYKRRVGNHLHGHVFVDIRFDEVDTNFRNAVLFSIWQRALVGAELLGDAVQIFDDTHNFLRKSDVAVLVFAIAMPFEIEQLLYNFRFGNFVGREGVKMRLCLTERVQKVDGL